MLDKVYKIFTEDEWARFQVTGEFSGSADDMRDGFIHLSTRNQIDRVIKKFFKEKGPLHVAVFSTTGLPGDLKWEESASGETYPHLYGMGLFLVDVTAQNRL